MPTSPFRSYGASSDDRRHGAAFTGSVSLSSTFKAPIAVSCAATLLVVDDDEETREALRALLSREYDVSTAVDGVDGYEKTIENPPDLIISDVTMPRLDGSEGAGGELRVTDVPGMGCVFTVELARLPPGAAQAASHHPPTSANRVVCDEYENRAEHRHEDAPKIETRHSRLSDEMKGSATDERANHAEDHIHQQTLAAAVHHLACNET